MSTVYNQTVDCRFGVELNALLTSGEWKRLDAAVAWVRRSGLRHLMPSLRQFLSNQGVIRITVGIDLENTSEEGLQDLLSLASHGDIVTTINHNEHPSVTFHPKVYLFSGDERARLIIGSNNLTESGLYTNTEAGLQIDAADNDPVIQQVRTALQSWAHPGSRLAQKLDSTLLQNLVQSKYVISEAALHRRRAKARKRLVKTSVGGKLKGLFGSRGQTVPPVPGQAPPGSTPGTRGSQAATAQTTSQQATMPPTSGPGAVLIMRPRLARKTQIQIPIRLVRTPFLAGIAGLVSAHDGRTHPISPATTRNKPTTTNTYKMELPEGKTIAQPVLRIWHAKNGTVRYRAYASNSPVGAQILRRLEQGRHTTPPQTILTRPDKPNSSTWFRLI